MHTALLLISYGIVFIDCDNTTTLLTGFLNLPGSSTLPSRVYGDLANRNKPLGSSTILSEHTYIENIAGTVSQILGTVGRFFFKPWILAIVNICSTDDVIGQNDYKLSQWFNRTSW